MAEPTAGTEVASRLGAAGAVRLGRGSPPEQYSARATVRYWHLFVSRLMLGCAFRSPRRHEPASCVPAEDAFVEPAQRPAGARCLAIVVARGAE